MALSPTPPSDHIEFDALCEQVDEYDTLPEPGPAAYVTAEQQEDSLNAEILAGLVSP